MFSKKDLSITESRIRRMAVCRFKVGNIKVFWKHWTKSDHKYLTRSHSSNIWNGVLLYKLQKKIQWRWLSYSKKKFFLLRCRTLFKILYWKDLMQVSCVTRHLKCCPVNIIVIKQIFKINVWRRFNSINSWPFD